MLTDVDNSFSFLYFVKILEIYNLDDVTILQGRSLLHEIHIQMTSCIVQHFIIHVGIISIGKHTFQTQTNCKLKIVYCILLRTVHVNV